jgi:hypothetical protein
MRLDGVDGDIQLGGDLAGRQHGGKVGENLQLPVTELVRPAVGRFQALETDDGSDAFHVARTSASTSSSGVGLPGFDHSQMSHGNLRGGSRSARPDTRYPHRHKPSTGHARQDIHLPGHRDTSSRAPAFGRSRIALTPKVRKRRRSSPKHPQSRCQPALLARSCGHALGAPLEVATSLSVNLAPAGARRRRRRVRSTCRPGPRWRDGCRQCRLTRQGVNLWAIFRKSCRLDREE